jgi:hypothetical protein
MISANWSNIKTSINNTFQELKREVHNQMNLEIKRPYPQIPKVKNIVHEQVSNQVQQTQRTEDRSAN